MNSFKDFPQNTTSKEIEFAFLTAIDSQTRVDKLNPASPHSDIKVSHVLFFDEVGLTSSNRQPLKVLNYFLDKPKIGFVGISNKVLDPARMNRAVVVWRENPGTKSLKALAAGILGFRRVLGDSGQSSVDKLLRRGIYLSKGFVKVMDNNRLKKFFGLRDFYHFLRYIQRRLTDASQVTEINKSFGFYVLMLPSLERNFNGISDLDFIFLCKMFFDQLEKGRIMLLPFEKLLHFDSTN